MLGLGERPRSGRPATVSAATRARIVALTIKAPPAGLSHWSSWDVAQRVGESASTVQRVWRGHAQQPHQHQTFKFTTDPDAAAKIEDVVGLHLAPPTNAVVPGVDEKTRIQALERTYPRHALHVILDNSSTHSTPAVRTWRAAHPRVTFHFTPTGASWLILIEAWVGILTRRSVRRGSFRSVRALVRHIEHYLAHWNADPTPFVWSKTPAEIIKKAVRR